MLREVAFGAWSPVAVVCHFAPRTLSSLSYHNHVPRNHLRRFLMVLY